MQYDLWWGKMGYSSMKILAQHSAIQLQKNEKLEQENNKLYSKILSLRHGGMVLEGMIRRKLGFIKQGETLYQFSQESKL
jgi:cell division protein FtsB